MAFSFSRSPANMATDRAKGKVTALSSIFPEEEALKASKRVQETIADRQRQLDEVQTFIADNNNLIKLVQILPDELHHDIMVPFGKAAFFPGRLIHTNEFLVFIGEGYYVERTSKQTVDILKRRGKALESQVGSLEAMMQDLKAEASFFETTAAEAREGYVEIREDYIDEDSEGSLQRQDVPETSGADGVSRSLGDDEYARMMSRLDELEKEELAAESVEELDEDETDLDLQPPEDERRDTGKYNDGGLKIEHFQDSQKGVYSGDKVLRQSISNKYDEDATTSHGQVPYQMSKPDAGRQMSKPVTDSLKAFPGSIIERTDNLPNNPIQQATARPSAVQSSKPVSRFKMQRK
ncbi:hypothetical protein Dimus_009556 [Dionaea muscipula]